MSDKDIQVILRKFLSETSTLSMATVDSKGLPHACNLNFVHDDRLNLYFISSPESAHSRHITKQPHVAATAYSKFGKPDDIHGVQIHGSVEAIKPDDFRVIWAMYCSKFPYAHELEFRARAEQFYRLRPSWFRWIDNAVRFGFKIESDWDGEIT